MEAFTGVGGDEWAVKSQTEEEEGGTVLEIFDDDGFDGDAGGTGGRRRWRRLRSRRGFLTKTAVTAPIVMVWDYQPMPAEGGGDLDKEGR